MQTRRKIGDMVVAANLLTPEQLDAAVVASVKASKKLGDFLVSSGLVKEEEVVNLLAVQLRIARYSPDEYPVDASLASLLTSDVAQRHKVVPLCKKNNVLHVGMVDPTDTQALDAIERAARGAVEPVICTHREIHLLTGSIYGMSTGLGTIIDGVTAIEPTFAGEEKESEDLQVSSLKDLAEGAPVVRSVNWIISQAVREGASDIHISPEKRYIQLRFRIDGELREVPAPPIGMHLAIVSRIKILSHMDIAVSRIPQDGRFTTRIDNKEINVRVSSVPTVNGENVVLRLLDMSATEYTLDGLGMAADDRQKIEDNIFKPYGMILSTGPTGSGKSTSLYSILRRLHDPSINIITVEDPVEYRMEKIRQLQLNVRAGMTMAGGLKYILRQDPDVIMVGEIRDAETARVAVQAALTGHRVLSTVHTNDAAGAVTRLMDLGVEPFLVAAVLLVCFAQRLIRKVCPNCGIPYEPSPEVLKFWGLQGGPDVKFMMAGSCYRCTNSGYYGRTGLFEVFCVNAAIKEMIAAKCTAQDIVQAAQRAGDLKLLKDDAARKIAAGVTTVEEALATVIV